MRLLTINRCDNGKSSFDPLRLAVLAALFVVIGDFITLVLAIIAVQESEVEKESSMKDIEQQICELQNKLKEMDRKR